MYQSFFIVCICQSVSQSISQSVSQSVSKCISVSVIFYRMHLSVSQSVNVSVYQSFFIVCICQSVSQSVSQSVNVSVYQSFFIVCISQTVRQSVTPCIKSADLYLPAPVVCMNNAISLHQNGLPPDNVCTILATLGGHVCSPSTVRNNSSTSTIL